MLCSQYQHNPYVQKQLSDKDIMGCVYVYAYIHIQNEILHDYKSGNLSPEQ